MQDGLFTTGNFDVALTKLADGEPVHYTGEHLNAFMQAVQRCTGGFVQILRNPPESGVVVLPIIVFPDHPVTDRS